MELSELANAVLVEIRLYGGIEILFGKERELRLRLESDFHVISGEKNTLVHFRPGFDEPSTGLDALAALFRKRIRAAIATDEGDLDIEFSDAGRIVSNHDPDYEAWMLTTPSLGLVVSLPGGGLG